MLIDPETVAPLAGAVMETDGAWVSGRVMMIEALLLAETLPAASLAQA
jgi:hypothetical protein